MFGLQQQLQAGQGHQRAADRAGAGRQGQERGQERDEQEQPEGPFAEAIEQVAEGEFGAFRGDPLEQRPRRQRVVRAQAVASSPLSTRATSSLSMRAPSRSMTSMRQPSQVKCSPVSGMRPNWAIAMPAMV